MRALRPSQVRKRILREHVALRKHVDRLASLAEQLDARHAATHAAVLGQAQLLYRELREHIDFEDKLLVPALREVDAWGWVRANELQRHHALQREQLVVLAERSSAESPQGLARLIAEITAELRADIAHEDCDLLAADLLRDDVVLIDCEAG